MAVGAARSTAPVGPQRRSGRRSRGRRHSRVLDRVVFVVVRAVIGALGALPLAVALRIAAGVALVVYAIAGGLRRVGMRNLALAFPERPLAERRRILRTSFANLGRMAAE